MNNLSQGRMLKALWLKGLNPSHSSFYTNLQRFRASQVNRRINGSSLAVDNLLVNHWSDVVQVMCGLMNHAVSIDNFASDEYRELSQFMVMLLQDALLYSKSNIVVDLISPVLESLQFSRNGLLRARQEYLNLRAINAFALGQSIQPWFLYNQSALANMTGMNRRRSGMNNNNHRPTRYQFGGRNYYRPRRQQYYYRMKGDKGQKGKSQDMKKEK